MDEIRDGAQGQRDHSRSSARRKVHHENDWPSVAARSSTTVATGQPNSWAPRMNSNSSALRAETPPFDAPRTVRHKHCQFDQGSRHDPVQSTAVASSPRWTTRVGGSRGLDIELSQARRPASGVSELVVELADQHRSQPPADFVGRLVVDRRRWPALRRPPSITTRCEVSPLQTPETISLHQPAQDNGDLRDPLGRRVGRPRAAYRASPASWMSAARAQPASSRSDGNSTRNTVSSTERRISRSTQTEIGRGCVRDGGLEISPDAFQTGSRAPLELVEPLLRHQRRCARGVPVETRRAEEPGGLPTSRAAW
jgi:hypothetical protein